MKEWSEKVTDYAEMSGARERGYTIQIFRAEWVS